ncbi:MAG TPA: hypothetical protein GXX37_06850 [Clostridiaceae bacterium]|nr:hypothetical protein [Clostridiaceae bacterium]
MFMTKKRNPMQLLCQLTAMILIMLQLVGCGRNAALDEDKLDTDGKQEVAAQYDEEQGADPEQQQGKVSKESNSPFYVSSSFSAYMEEKNKLLSRLSDALTTNPDTVYYSMSILDVVMVDIILAPAACFGLGQNVAIATLESLGAEGVVYSESGNQYSIKYQNNDGKKYELEGEYNKAADSLKCIVKIDGKEGLISEYLKTSFGYVSQIYTISEDGSAHIYQMAVSDENGALGISKVSAAPPALTDDEKIDFPKQCQEWYAIEDDTVTGVTSDGKKISFVYNPSAD